MPKAISLCRALAVVVATILVANFLVANQDSTSEPTRAPRAHGDLIVFKLDPHTEIASEDMNRTDRRYFHGVRIVRTARVFDDSLTQEIYNWALIAKQSGKRPMVRDGDYGIRILSAKGLPSIDVVVCFYCQSVRARAVGRVVADERELPLSTGEEGRLRLMLERSFGKPLSK